MKIFKTGQKNTGRRHLRIPLSIKALLLFAALILFLNILAWNSVRFDDWYLASVFPIWVGTYGRLSGLAAFSVGEVLIVIAVIWVLLIIPVLFIKKIRRKFLIVTAWTIAVVLLIFTLNCFIVYHAHGYPKPELSAEEREQRYSAENLASLRDYIVEQCNTLAESVPRDDTGTVVFEGTDYTGSGRVSFEVRDEIAQESIRCMQRLSADFPLLSGYYPKPKGMFFSDLCSQMNMRGYYFPFSMEANYNTNMTVLNYPSCMTHELAHLKGYMLEDDCSMLAFLACLRSDDPAFRYSGYLSVLNYVDNDFYASIGKDRDEYDSHVAISDLVRSDNTFLVPDEKDRIEEESPLDTEKVTQATKTVSDESMKANGVKTGWNSYNEVVKLLLDWYADGGTDGKTASAVLPQRGICLKALLMQVFQTAASVLSHRLPHSAKPHPRFCLSEV